MGSRSAVSACCVGPAHPSPDSRTTSAAYTRRRCEWTIEGQMVLYIGAHAFIEEQSRQALGLAVRRREKLTPKLKPLVELYAEQHCLNGSDRSSRRQWALCDHAMVSSDPQLPVDSFGVKVCPLKPPLCDSQLRSVQTRTSKEVRDGFI